MNCTTCGATIPENAKFCNKCGRPSQPAAAPPAATGQGEDACPSCGNRLPPNAKFCAKCGADIAREKAPAEVVASAEPRAKEEPLPEPVESRAAEMPSVEPTETVVVGPEPTGPSCPTCGVPLPPDAKFCGKCGRTIGAGTPAAASPSTPPQPTPASPPAPRAYPPPDMGAPSQAPGIAIQADWLAQAGRTLQRIFVFDSSVYQELRADPNATVLSLGIAAIAIFAFGLGGFLWANIEVSDVVDFRWDGLFWKSALVGTLIAFGLWLAWIFVTVAVITQVYRESLRLEEVFRVAGAASAPLAIGFFMFIPGISFGVALVAVVAWVATSIFALQAAFEMPPQRAAVASLVGFAAWAVILPLIVGSEPLGPGIMLFDSLKDLV